MSLDNFLAINLPFSLDLFPENTYLVGGAVRDVLLERKRDYLDLDFVTPHSAISIAKKISNLYNAGFVVLDQQRNIARVVFPSATIDIAQQEGDNVTTDLSRRDYTINAIAFDGQNNKIIDPLQGQKDLQQGIIRMISPRNLQEDPLRLLRGYRQACQLDFTIEENTRLTIKELAPLLSNVASERINSELGYLLGNIRGSKWLTEAFKDNLLSVFFPYLTLLQINLLHKIDKAIELLENSHSKLLPIQSQWRGLAKLVCLTDTNPEIADRQLTNLKYSRQEIKTVTTVLKNIPTLKEKNFEKSLKSQYFFFQLVGQVLPILAIFALANNLPEDLMTMLIDRHCDNQDKVAHPQPLLTGNDLIKSLQLSPSPLIGELLTQIQIAYIEEKISNQKEAIRWVQEYMTKL